LNQAKKETVIYMFIRGIDFAFCFKDLLIGVCNCLDIGVLCFCILLILSRVWRY